jgi:hypothetical protein
VSPVSVIAVDERTPGGIRTRINRATRSHLQRNGLHALGVGDDRIYIDHGLTGANRDRSGLRFGPRQPLDVDRFLA